jgi:hypothetical protein
LAPGSANGGWFIGGRRVLKREREGEREKERERKRERERERMA